MDRFTLSQLPFLAAFFVALAGMPLDIFQFNQRQVGTAKVSPWQRIISAAVERLTAPWTRLLAMLRSPRMWHTALASLTLILLLTHHIGAEGLVVLGGLTIEETREKINKLGVDMSAIMAKAKDETRELTSDEEKKFDEMDVDREKLLASEKRLVRAAELDGSVGRRTEHRQPSTETRKTGDPNKNKETAAIDQVEALRGFFMAGSNRRTSAQVDAAKRLGLDIDNKSMFLGLAARPPESARAEDLREWEARGYLGVDIISPDLGGHYAVPNETMRALEVALLAYGGMRSVASVLRTDTGANLPIPTMNDTSNEGAIIGESIEETDETLPTIGQLVLEAFTYSSKKIPVSVEFMQDNAINFATRVGEILGERIARITNRHFTVGTGNSQPKGIVTAATASGVTAASATAVTYDEIMGLIHSVDPAYRNNGAKFMFHDNLLLLLKKIKVPQFSGDTAGQPLWRPGMAVSAPDTIDGYGYVINQHMPLPTSAQKSMLFGALNKYQIRDVRTIEVMRLNELRAEFRQVVWLAWSRHDGDLLDAGTHPVKYLLMNT